MTLVEVLVGLVLFALIGMAGFSVLDQAIRVQARTEGRLARLAEIQRMMHIVTLDFMQASGASLSLVDGAVSFRRDAATGEIAVSYGLEDGTLVRSVSGGPNAAVLRQNLLSDVGAIRWGFLAPQGDWVDAWPQAARPGASANPAAVSLDLAMAGPGLSGDLRRVVALPAEAGP
jgi:general secretion pathway protein J